VDGNSVSIGSGNTAAIDTGTTLIGAPTAAVTAIWAAVSGSVPLTGNMTGFNAFRMYSFCPPSLAVDLAVTPAKGVNNFQAADGYSHCPITSMQLSAEHCDIIRRTRMADQPC
jgi:hypothetical protein